MTVLNVAGADGVPAGGDAICAIELARDGISMAHEQATGLSVKGNAASHEQHTITSIV